MDFVEAREPSITIPGTFTVQGPVDSSESFPDKHLISREFVVSPRDVPESYSRNAYVQGCGRCGPGSCGGVQVGRLDGQGRRCVQ